MNRYEMMKWRTKSAIAARKSADGRHAPRPNFIGRIQRDTPYRIIDSAAGCLVEQTNQPTEVFRVGWFNAANTCQGLLTVFAAECISVCLGRKRHEGSVIIQRGFTPMPGAWLSPG